MGRDPMTRISPIAARRVRVSVVRLPQVNNSDKQGLELMPRPVPKNGVSLWVGWRWHEPLACPTPFRRATLM